MSSALSTSKQQSTYPQSRLSIFSASVSEPGTGSRRSAMTSGKTTSSNNVSGLSVLNSANHNKPLRVERIDRGTRSIKWASSVSDESETMKMCNNDHISKNIEEVSKLKEVGKNKGRTMSKNERRKNNQNNLEDKLLNLKLKDLDRQQSTLQAGIKREHYKLLDIYMNSKANNLNFLKAKADENSSNIDLSELNKSNNKKFHRLSNFNTTERETSRYGRETERDSQGSATYRSHSSFQTREMERYLEFINQPPPAPKPSIFSKIDERFIDQKIKYFPSYLRKAKGSVMSSDVDTALSKSLTNSL